MPKDTFQEKRKKMPYFLEFLKKKLKAKSKNVGNNEDAFNPRKSFSLLILSKLAF